jgi:DNA-binding transcriptional MerR regulator
MVAVAPESSRRYTISQLAAELQISPRAIRFYEEKGLISPARSAGNQRIYTRRDRARLTLILRGKRFGYRLEEISRMIGLTDAEPVERGQIQQALVCSEATLREIRDKQADLQRMQDDLLTVRDKLLRRLAELDTQPPLPAEAAAV